MVVGMLKMSKAPRRTRPADVANAGTGPIRFLAGRPYAKCRPVADAAWVVEFTAGCSIEFVTVRPAASGRGARLMVAFRSGGVRARWVDDPANVVADAWEFLARSNGVYAGRSLIG